MPLLLSLAIWRSRWWQTYLIMMMGMLIDVDHLLANPVYDPDRCSIGFHPLHTLLPIAIYVVMLWPKQTRVIGAGLCIHILLDAADCITP